MLLSILACIWILYAYIQLVLYVPGPVLISCLLLLRCYVVVKPVDEETPERDTVLGYGIGFQTHPNQMYFYKQYMKTFTCSAG
jgi:hypothetical protein